jgi:hypothetical protein
MLFALTQQSSLSSPHLREVIVLDVAIILFVVFAVLFLTPMPEHDHEIKFNVDPWSTLD